ncbi:hypothetical protein POJ06DRAFT_112679 [Lipomyces tetrasporus]|uniref:Uncharacterized protein n=1 Tax=Lipomyces tetrasporus TaxID=54092 RepID=A0AAD7QQL6_9ASCO|nr:uncharacterized protein POJ06DRAFT_112679 [Lipomyces tetrasporus]KAJ8099560.1 hypothetical protein POJ06DRAFT_112679 [Lipomyces tetrasporus]
MAGLASEFRSRGWVAAHGPPEITELPSGSDIKRTSNSNTNPSSRGLHSMMNPSTTSRLTAIQKHTTMAAADKSKPPYIPLAGCADDGWSKEDEATATCFCGAVQLAFSTQGPGLVDTFILPVPLAAGHGDAQNVRRLLSGGRAFLTCEMIPWKS